MQLIVTNLSSEVIILGIESFLLLGVIPIILKSSGPREIRPECISLNDFASCKVNKMNLDMAIVRQGRNSKL